jgi:hypothetical protein
MDASRIVILERPEDWAWRQKIWVITVDEPVVLPRIVMHTAHFAGKAIAMSDLWWKDLPRYTFVANA